MNIYIGNLSYSSTEQSVRAAFEQFGAVDSVRIIMDRDTGRSRGFGFVDMPSDTEGQAAISSLDGQDLEGRNLVVNQARPREERPPRRSDW